MKSDCQGSFNRSGPKRQVERPGRMRGLGTTSPWQLSAVVVPRDLHLVVVVVVMLQVPGDRVRSGVQAPL